MESNVTALRVFSFGGGVQSTAALVLAAEKQIDYPVFIFANVGEDSEHPETLRYVEEYAKPYAAAHGIELIEVRGRQDGATTLYQETLSRNTRAIPIPARTANGAPGVRSCTSNYKIRPVGRETKRRGATNESPAVVGLGISLDEFQRMNTSGIPWQVFEYPLIDLRLTRDGCEQIIERAGLPVPPKSACWFCPFLRPSRWREMKERDPALFNRAVVFERDINIKRSESGKVPLFLTRLGQPLDQAFAGEQAMMDFDDACDSGFCLT
jgi:hypothetical protein